ncbi:hypothetical protein DICPUDRAFT_149493 [Dictyostelium purpureum]|uniref:GST C-terminal domain-containing protein n=1 Tax=Dictyostelium purpureum TaxID=5786 RepID=F0ZDW1_DICPU|nr:uncharacterized protein DICPUDRAFT_149493 [Dictyostelium purpureum]EGC37850.1 hypothetical protein DICPUDRAFT_149493 [Dictyostelium purpureum]|eukprot:XP_003285600.1 hypothetical protein DICPUDRAFT_149493 [Dictyostelium purpureum]
MKGEKIYNFNINSNNINNNYQMDKEGHSNFLIQNNTGPITNWISSTHFVYKPERNRYHLYVSLGCPFACRALMTLMIKGLEDIIDVSIVDYYLHNPEGEGWRFIENSKEGTTIDKVNNFKKLKQVYLLSNPNYVGKVTVPVLFDKKTQSIVNNESGDIMKILNSAFNDYSKFKNKNSIRDISPKSLEKKINKMNDYISKSINLGVYNVGLAKSQKDYNLHYNELFEAMDRLEIQLNKTRYLFGNQITETDLRLFSSLIRFDAIYYSLFKCNKKQLKDYPNLLGYVMDIYQMEEIKPTIDFKHIKGFYYLNPLINQYEIIPNGPDLNYLNITLNKNSKL